MYDVKNWYKLYIKFDCQKQDYFKIVLFFCLILVEKYIFIIVMYKYFMKKEGLILYLICQFKNLVISFICVFFNDFV